MMIITVSTLLLMLGNTSSSPLRRIRKVAISNPPEYTDVLSTMTKSSHPSQGSTIRSSFTPLTTKRTAKPLNLKMPGPVTPLSPVEDDASPSTLHLASATPLKSMSTLDEEIMTSKPLQHPDFYEPGCICCCHENEIHPPADEPISPASVEQLHEPKIMCPEKCKCAKCCKNCTEYVCKPLHVVAQEQPVHINEKQLLQPTIGSCVCPQGCVKSSNEINTYPPHILNNTVNHPECGHDTCTCRTDTIKNIDENNCMIFRKLPLCVTKCNNNFLGYHLNRKLNSNNNNEQVLKQPTSRTFSTTQLTQKYIKFSDTTVQMDAGYNPIHPMPTMAAMNAGDDVIIHHIMVAQPMMPPLDMTQMPVEYMFFESNRLISRDN